MLDWLFLVYEKRFGTTFGAILGSLLYTCGVLGCLRGGLERLWAACEVNLGVLGPTWSPWGRILVDVGALLVDLGQHPI